MNTQVLMERERDSQRKFTIASRGDVRKALIMKYGNLTEASMRLRILFSRLSAALAGRESLVYVIEALQSDLRLTDEQVLEFWPLVRRWPRAERQLS